MYPYLCIYDGCVSEKNKQGSQMWRECITAFLFFICEGNGY